MKYFSKYLMDSSIILSYFLVPNLNNNFYYIINFYLKLQQIFFDIIIPFYFYTVLSNLYPLSFSFANQTTPVLVSQVFLSWVLNQSFKRGEIICLDLGLTVKKSTSTPTQTRRVQLFAFVRQQVLRLTCWNHKPRRDMHM